jgi:hypothetical protein
MAKIETIALNADTTEAIINITASVGANGVNRKEDVIVVQALLKYALKPRPYFHGVQFPEPTGANIKATAEIIKKFQRYNNKTEPVKIPIDGRIDPLSGGKYMPGKRKYWTIYALQYEAMEVALLSGDGDAIEAICRKWSVVERILKENGVGSLGLALE